MVGWMRSVYTYVLTISTYEAVRATTNQPTLKIFFFFLFYMVSRAYWNTLLLLIQFRKKMWVSPLLL